MSEYSEKFKDPRWQRKRLEILERDGWCCQKCYDPQNPLHVHHRYYEQGKDPWDYPDEALVSLCEECHLYEKESRYDAEKSLIHELKMKFFSGGVLDIASGIYLMILQKSPDIVASAYAWAFEDPDMQTEILKKYLKYFNKFINKKVK
jgi:hypothetical protein